MEIYIPISILILSVFLGLVFLKQSIVEKRVKRIPLFFAGFLILFYALVLAVFWGKINDSENLTKIFKYVFLASFGLIGLAFLFGVSSNINKNHLYDRYLGCIENDRLFVLLDKNDKIKAASSTLVEALKDKEQKVIGRKFFDLFDNMFKVCQINEQELTNKDLRRAFYSLRDSKNEESIKREIKVYDKKNNPYVLSFSDNVIITNGKYQGHVLIGSSKSGQSVLNVEEELETKNAELLNIKLKFKTHLELTEEGIFFLNLDKNYIWGNDVFVRELNLNGNSVSRDEYLNLIHKDDLDLYMKIISSLTPQNPNYDTTYRFRTGANYSFVREFGKRLFDSTSSEIMGYVEPIHSSHYERSNIPELDDIKSSDELMTDLQALYKQGRTFQLATFKINNIPDINIKYGRAIGNMVMAEYLKAIWLNFVEDKRIYRTAGLEFTFIITDFRKMDVLQQALKKDQILTPSTRYGSITIQADVYMGIATSTEAPKEDALVIASQKSLKTALMDQVRTNYIYYKDIR